MSGLSLASFARDCARIARKWLASAVAPMLTGNTGGDRFHHSAIRKLGFWLWDWRLGRTDPTGPADHLQGTVQEIFCILCCTRPALPHFPRRPRERTECSFLVSGSAPSFAAPRQGINPLPKNSGTARHGSIRNCACSPTSAWLFASAASRSTDCWPTNNAPVIYLLAPVLCLVTVANSL